MAGYQKLLIPLPTRGYVPDVEATLLPPGAVPTLTNMRAAHNGRAQTRLGISRWTSDHAQSLPVAAAINYLTNFYGSTATYRLAAASGQLYERLSSATAWTAVTGGSGLGTSPTNGVYCGATLRDFHFFTDRTASSKLRRYAVGVALASVSQPAAPAAAPGLVRRTWKILETWAGSAGSLPTNWTESETANFSLIQATGTDDATPDFVYWKPAGASEYNIARLRTDNTGSKRETVSRSDASVTLESNTIAFWMQQETKKHIVSFEFGVTGHGEFSTPIDPDEGNQPFLIFVDIGALPSLQYRRFIVRRVPNQQRDCYLGPIVLPGRLQGLYRWRYANAERVSGAITRESELSPVTGGGEFEDFSHIGVSYESKDSRPLEKCCGLTFTSDSGADADTNLFILYRNGGVAPTLVDERGQDVWLEVAQIPDIATTLNQVGGVAIGDTTATLTAVTTGGTNPITLAAGDFLVFEPGTANKEEFVEVASVAGNVATLKTAFVFAHSNGVTVRAAYVDNKADYQIAANYRAQPERDDPPTNIKWLRASPWDERLWIANYNGRPTGVRVSNRATPERPRDYQVFPDGVDPITRGSLLQGWGFDLGGQQSGDEIMWFDFFRGKPHFLTKHAGYVCHALSQADWGPQAVPRSHDVGCIAGETAKEAEGWLYWAAPGPKVVRWNGAGQIEDITYQQVASRLLSAPTGQWDKWFARVSRTGDGTLYRLFFVPSGTTVTECLTFNVTKGVWEDETYGSLHFKTATVWDGGADVHELYVAHGTSGNIYQFDTGNDDAGTAIAGEVKSARVPFPEGLICRVEQVYVRAPALTDTFTLKVRVGGSQYKVPSGASAYVDNTAGADLERQYAGLSFSGSGDKELWQTVSEDMLGRWVQIGISGNWSNRPSIREIVVYYSIFSDERIG